MQQRFETPHHVENELLPVGRILFRIGQHLAELPPLEYPVLSHQHLVI